MGTLIRKYDTIAFPVGAPVKRDVLRPVEPNEPDTEIEVGYSKDLRKRLYIIFKDREVKLTNTLFRLFVHFSEPYYKEGQTEFTFADISGDLTGDEFKMKSSAIESSIYRLAGCLSEIQAPFTVIFRKETLYVRKIAEVVNNFEDG